MKNGFSKCDRALTKMTLREAVTNEFPKKTFSKDDTCTNANISVRNVSNLDFEKTVCKHMIHT